MNALPPGHLLLRLFLPFAAGYLLSYLFRTSNAVVGPLISRELQLPDHALGLLTSTYFLAFGAAQLPLGLLLDRYGSRRVEAMLLLIAASGAVVFAQANDVTGLALARALIGLGVSACLMAAFKAFLQWFPAERQAALIGWIMSAGGLGAVFASQPLEALIGVAGWREVTLGLAVATLAVALLIWFAVPEKPQPAYRAGWAAQIDGLKQVATARVFWRYAPMMCVCLGGFLAIQGLWVSRWMAEIEGLGRAQIALQLTLFNGAFLAGCLFMGFATTPLLRRGWRPTRILTVVVLTTLFVFAAINVLAGSGQNWLWAAMAFFFPLGNIAYPIVAQSLPLELSGRANTALNLAVFVGAFGLQWGMGVAVDTLQPAGWSASAAFRATFAALLFLQIAAVGWMLMARDGPRPAARR